MESEREEVEIGGVNGVGHLDRACAHGARRPLLEELKGIIFVEVLMVSVNAASSSERVLTMVSHSASLVAQFFSMSAKNLLSSSTPAAESERSLLMSRSTCPYPAASRSQRFYL